MRKFRILIVAALALVMLLGIAAPASAAPWVRHGFHSKAECSAYWRPVVVKWLTRYGINTADNRAHALNVIWGESRGNPYARNGQHRGICQFRYAWVAHRYDWRFDPNTSIRRMCKSIKEGGHRNWYRHWKATYRG